MVQAVYTHNKQLAHSKYILRRGYRGVMVAMTSAMRKPHASEPTL